MPNSKTSNPSNGLGKVIPPTFQFVNIYFIQKGRKQVEAKAFFGFYSANNWTTPKDKKVRDWKAAASDWIWNLSQLEKAKKAST